MLFIKKNEENKNINEKVIKQSHSAGGCGCGKKPLTRQITKEDLIEIVKRNKSKYM